jgi:N-formylglutamate amidohydrolase
MSEPTYDWLAGSTPLLISVPHGGTVIPADIRAQMTDAADSVPDTDWHVPKLYDFAPALGVGLLTATHSRYVIDLNRNPDGAVLYAGADNTELVPTRRFDYVDLYPPGKAPDAAEIARRREAYWQPYHDKLVQELEVIRARHGYAVLLDAHSICSRVPRFFDGRLPDLNLGTADGTSCAAFFQFQAWTVLSAAAGFSAICNGRFKGGAITRRYGQPATGVHALQLEIAQSCYMDERPPFPWSHSFAAPLIGVLQRLIDALLILQPGHAPVIPKPVE